jgi:hypothetical protein
MAPMNKEKADKPDKITDSTPSSAQAAESSTAPARSRNVIDPEKWHINLKPAPHRYAWNVPTCKEAPIPPKDVTSSIPNISVSEAEKKSHFPWGGHNAKCKTTSAIQKHQPYDDDGAYPPRKDSLGKQAATKALQETTLLSEEADTQIPDSRPTNVQDNRIMPQSLGSVRDDIGDHKPVGMAEPRNPLFVESDVSHLSSKNPDKITDAKMLQPIAMPTRGSTTSTPHSRTDNSDNQGKESGARGGRQSFNFASTVDEFRSDGKTPGRLAAQASSTDSSDNQVKEDGNRRTRGPSNLVSRVEEFLKSNGRLTDRAWLNKRTRRRKLVSISMGNSVTLQEFLTGLGSISEHTEDSKVHTPRRRRLRRAQSFCDLRHNVKSDGSDGESQGPTSDILSQKPWNILKTVPQINLDGDLPMIQTQWDILDSAAPMEIKGISGVMAEADGLQGLGDSSMCEKPWDIHKHPPMSIGGIDGKKSAQNLCTQKLRATEANC